jgi:hypothetical protein
MDLPPSLPSVAHALSKNKRLLLESSKEFQSIVLSLKKGTYLGTRKDKAKHISFAMKQSAKLVHHAKYRYNINKTMHQEIEFFCKNLQHSSSILWETPMLTSYQECLWQWRLATAGPLKVWEDTPLVLDSGSTYHSQKK